MRYFFGARIFQTILKRSVREVKDGVDEEKNLGSISFNRVAEMWVFLVAICSESMVGARRKEGCERRDEGFLWVDPQRHSRLFSIVHCILIR